MSTPTSLLKACETTSRPRGILVDRLAVGVRPERSTASIVTAVRPSFCDGFDHAGAAAALVFHLVLEFGDLGARAFGRDFLLHLGRDAFIGRRHAGLDLADLDQRHAEPALHRLADLAGGQRKRGIRDGGIDDRGFRDHAEVDVGQIEVALLGEVVERHARR